MPPAEPTVRAVLGIDLGTTEARAGLFTADGERLGHGSAGYPTDRDGDGRAEQNPRDWWSAVASAVRAAGAEARERTGTDVLPAAICAVAQGPTLAIVDEAGAPVRPAVTWQDRRIGDGGFGLLPRIAWLGRAEPTALARARWLLTAWDAIALFLTGRAAASVQPHETPIDAAEALAAGARPDQLAPTRPVGAPLGELSAEAAARLGLPAGIPVIVGVNDGTASMLGAGLLEPGDAVDTGGASGGFGVYTPAPLELPGVFRAPAPIGDGWVAGGAMAATGAALDWLAGPVLGGASIEALLAEAAAVPPGADGLVFLPYLAGERAPIFDDGATGAFAGLTLAHGRGHLARAVLEAAGFAIRDVAEPIRSAGASVRVLRLAGRPSRSELWARIKADVTGLPTETLKVEGTAVMGAAILAAAGIGLVPSLEAGVRGMVRVERRFEPDPVAVARYDELFAVYRALYPATRAALGRD